MKTQEKTHTPHFIVARHVGMPIPKHQIYKEWSGRVLRIYCSRPNSSRSVGLPYGLKLVRNNRKKQKKQQARAVKEITPPRATIQGRHEKHVIKLEKPGPNTRFPVLFPG